MDRTTLAALVLTVGLAGALAACTEPAAPGPGDASARKPAAGASQSELVFGEAGTVAWEPTAALSGQLSIRVEAVRAGRFEDFTGLVAAGITQDNQPYYADVVIRNQGEAEVGGLDVPLYLADSQQTLTPPSTFAKPFRECASGPLPASFGADRKTKMCLVFFASPGARFTSITFQPSLDEVAVRWTGTVGPPIRSATPKRR